MNKAQKIIILISFLLLLLSVIYPPYLRVINARNQSWKPEQLKFEYYTQWRIICGTGWDWIFNLKGKFVTQTHPLESYYEYQKIRLDILMCELLAIGAIAGFFFLIVSERKPKPSPDFPKGN